MNEVEMVEVPTGVKILYLDVSSIESNPFSTHPPLDKPLPFFLTPYQIYSCILHDGKSLTTSYTSFIDPEMVFKEIKAVNGDNYVWLVSRDLCESYLDPTELIFRWDVVLEIKIEDVYLNSQYGRYRKNYHDCMESYDWQRGEEAFIKMAALIGVKVGRGLVVE